MPTLKQYAQLLVQYLRPQLKQTILLTLLIVGAITLQLAIPQLVRRFLDEVERGRTLEELLVTAGLFVLLALVAQTLSILGTYVGEDVAWRATNELRADLASHCLNLDMDFHKQYKPGELIERVDGDVNELANFFSRLVIQLGSNFLLLIGVLVLLWLIDWRVGLSITLIAVSAVPVLNWLNRRIVPRWQAVRQVEADLFGYLEEWLNGTEEIQANGAAPYVKGRLFEMMRRRWHSAQRAFRINLGVMSLPHVIPALAYIAAYLWGDTLFRNATLSVGSIYLIFYYVNTIREPLWSIQRQVQELQRAAASMNRIIGLFAVKPALKASGHQPLPPGPLAVSFEAVSFYYSDDLETPILRDVSFSLSEGRVLGLLGRTGSGKTTLTRLLIRFYDPTTGAVQLGSERAMVDLRDAPVEALRARIGMVTQDVQLFHATVRDNLTLFDERIPDVDIMEALEELGLSNWLASLPDGLDTQLEAANSLSAGEAQLLALGRVFLADAGLVILDEASSRLDPATEAMLERALDRLLAGRTAIVIAHRLRTVQRADEIMILTNGQIAEHGDRRALTEDLQSKFYQLLKVGMEDALA